MGLTPEVFEMMTVAEFVYASWGYAERVKEQMRSDWERERWSTYLLLSIQIDPKDRRDMIEMLPLPWERAIEVRELTIEERRERARKIIQGE